MRRGPRELSIFSMSALDVLATATGVFVLLLVLVMPYYRKSLDANAEIAARRVSTTEIRAKVSAIDEAALLYRGQADAALAEAERLNKAAAALEREAASRPAVVTRPSVPKPAVEPQGDRNVVDAIDLVFAIDTTASMGPVIRELASSMASIVRILQRLVPSVRIGVAAYSDRDTGLPPLQVLPLTPAERELPRVLAFLDALHESPIGSQTIEEDVHLGLAAAMEMPFRPAALQSIVLIGDAQAHPEYVEETLYQTRAFVAASDRRSISTLFATTPSAMRDGLRSRPYFAAVAEVGNGSFSDFAGSMIAGILLSVIAD
ncbi:MAG: vWA domain-containing protein [Rhodospirillales bacterium]|nr:vWA domain-containing protein [Rhodospirillales bacterium]